MFRYQVKSTNSSTDKHGDCEVCGKHASEVFHQMEQASFIDENGNVAWTYLGCHNLFGHKERLESNRRS